MPLMGSITSLQNAHVKAVERLIAKKRDRYREQQFVVEGYRLVHHALSRGHRPVFAFYTAAFAETPQGASLVSDLATGDAPVWEVSPGILASVTDTVTPQGLVAVLPMLPGDPMQVRQADLVLVLDALRTPGNLGTILRTAQATGVGAVICSPGTVDPYSPKVVRSGMGAQFDLPLVTEVRWSEIALLLAGKQVLAASADGECVMWDVTLTGPTALIVGSEAHGIGPEAAALAQARVRIPMLPSAESLNVAVATAALLFEAQRQRRAGEA
ncbi:MAG: TrmH family RNA methyltransferase [Anaerolineae bacterium]